MPQSTDETFPSYTFSLAVNVCNWSMGNLPESEGSNYFLCISQRDVDCEFGGPGRFSVTGVQYTGCRVTVAVDVFPSSSSVASVCALSG
ncbi:hypothetical protein LINPERHAP2_LOCUS9541 [Linum perenne]